MECNELEVVLGHLMYLKVIKELASSKEPLTKYKIVMKTGLKSVDVSKILENLVKMNWVIELDYNPKKYTLNFEKPIVRDLVNFLKKWGYIK